jgi:hypothetical protein
MGNSPAASIVVLALIGLLAASPVQAQVAAGPDIWRAFAEKIEPGRTLKVRLRSGQRFKATLLQVSEQGLTLHPKTRVPVPPQVVTFAEVASLEIDSGKGAGIGRAIAVGAAVAAGTFFGLMVLTLSVLSD